MKKTFEMRPSELFKRAETMIDQLNDKGNDNEAQVILNALNVYIESDYQNRHALENACNRFYHLIPIY
jgi:hypothetical protein